MLMIWFQNREKERTFSYVCDYVAAGSLVYRLPECIEDNFLSQMIDSPTWGDMILDLVVTSESELIGDVQTGGSLGCSSHTLVEFIVLRDMGKVSIVRWV